MGDKPIKRYHNNLLVAALAPLLLGGCVLPVGFQIASLFADGVSLVTTDKTLTDHGLSAITDQDCAMWRVLDDKEICHDVGAGDGPVMVADTGPDAAVETEVLPWQPVDERNALIDADDMNFTGTPGIVVAGLEPMTEPSAPLNDPADAYDLTVPDPPSAEYTPVPGPVLAEAPVEVAPVEVAPVVNGGTFLVIASYYRIGDAEQFARRHAAHETRVLAGTASGKKVYRVAVGPVDKAQRPTIRTVLVGAGFDDVWALTLKTPKIVVEVAALTE